MIMHSNKIITKNQYSVTVYSTFMTVFYTWCTIHVTYVKYISDFYYLFFIANIFYMQFGYFTKYIRQPNWLS